MKMNEQDTGVPVHYPLEIKRAVSIERESKQALAATITAISSNEISLQLARATSKLTFQKGQRIKIKYRKEEVLYCWKADVVNVSGEGNQFLTIAIRGEGVTTQQRKFLRLRGSVPLSFTVIDASEARLMGETEKHCETRDISVGGVGFETSLPLKVGDKLALRFDLSPLQQVSALGSVVRSEQVQGTDNNLNFVGLKFLQLEEKDQSLLLQFLSLIDGGGKTVDKTHWPSE